jgi:hypothetical protein
MKDPAKFKNLQGFESHPLRQNLLILQNNL